MSKELLGKSQLFLKRAEGSLPAAVIDAVSRCLDGVSVGPGDEVQVEVTLLRYRVIDETPQITEPVVVPEDEPTEDTQEEDADDAGDEEPPS